MPKISQYPAQTGASVANGDLFPIVDVGSPNVTEYITADELAQMPQLTSRYASRASTSGRFATATYTGGDISITSTSWVELQASLNLTLTGVTAGDVIQCGISAISGDATPIIFLDAVSLVGGSPVSSWSGASIGPARWGVAGWAMSGTQIGIGGSVTRAVVSGDLSAGSLTLGLQVRLNSAGTSQIDASANVPLTFWAVNLG